MRDQEVLRATKELAAYFKGARTGREARAALKIIKAFIRDRERVPPAARRPLPGRAAPGAPRGDKRPLRTAKRRQRRVKPASETRQPEVATESPTDGSIPSERTSEQPGATGHERRYEDDGDDEHHLEGVDSAVRVD